MTTMVATKAIGVPPIVGKEQRSCVEDTLQQDVVISLFFGIFRMTGRAQ